MFIYYLNTLGHHNLQNLSHKCTVAIKETWFPISIRIPIRQSYGFDFPPIVVYFYSHQWEETNTTTRPTKTKIWKLRIWSFNLHDTNISQDQTGHKLCRKQFPRQLKLDRRWSHHLVKLSQLIHDMPVINGEKTVFRYFGGY